MYEERIVAAAAATGAAIVDSFSSGNPPWVQGSAWLVAPARVMTNRHVLLSDDGAVRLVEETADRSAMQMRGDYKITIEFASDDRTPGEKIRRRVTGVLYVAKSHDPVDIAVLAIEPYERSPLVLVPASDPMPENLFVVGHPALMADIPEEVKAVFGKPDGRKASELRQARLMCRHSTA